VDSPGQGFHQLGSVAAVLGYTSTLLRQAASFDPFQRQVRTAIVLPDFVNLDNVRMLQAGHRLGLAEEPDELLPGGQGRRMEDLQGDNPAESALPCLVDHGHAAST
jgi:hypothetical protein